MKGTFETNLKRLRLKDLRYIGDGKPVTMTEADVKMLPIPVARKLIKALDTTDSEKVGKVVREGDGISTAIGFELGKPIEFQAGKESIKEIEFLATTYGEIEDALCTTDPLEQILALLRTVAKPVHGTLSALPSSAIEQISLADGVTLARDVLPRFLKDSDESD
jgi:hypothetical protein